MGILEQWKWVKTSGMVIMHRPIQNYCNDLYAGV